MLCILFYCTGFRVIKFITATRSLWSIWFATATSSWQIGFCGTVKLIQSSSPFFRQVWTLLLNLKICATIMSIHSLLSIFSSSTSNIVWISSCSSISNFNWSLNWHISSSTAAIFLLEESRSSMAVHFLWVFYKLYPLLFFIKEVLYSIAYMTGFSFLWPLAQFLYWARLSWTAWSLQYQIHHVDIFHQVISSEFLLPSVPYWRIF